MKYLAFSISPSKLPKNLTHAILRTVLKCLFTSLSLFTLLFSLRIRWSQNGLILLRLNSFGETLFFFQYCSGWSSNLLIWALKSVANEAKSGILSIVYSNRARSSSQMILISWSKIFVWLHKKIFRTSLKSEWEDCSFWYSLALFLTIGSRKFQTLSLRSSNECSSFNSIYINLKLRWDKFKVRFFILKLTKKFS